MSSVAAVRQARISFDKISELNPWVNALVNRRPKKAIIEDVNMAFAKYPESPLAGSLVGIKDNIATMDSPTQCASKALEGYISPFEATVVTRLIKAGMVPVGKTNMDEFAMGSTTTHTIYGPVINPRYPSERRTAGGSSGGSAAAVAAGMCKAALGTDTGGSVRLPSAYCGVVGFKPTYGRISRYGIVSYAQSLDTVGIMAQDIDTVRHIFTALSLHDPKDPTSLSQEFHDRNLQEYINHTRQVKHLRIGVPQEFFVEDMDPNVTHAWQETLAKILKAGHSLHVVSVPSLRHCLPVYFMSSPSEASSNLARYDGIRYGYRAPMTSSEQGGESSFASKTRSESLGSEVKRRLMLGTYSLSSGAAESHFIRAQKVRRLVQEDFNNIFAQKHPLEGYQGKQESGGGGGECDLILTPSATRSLPPTLEEIGGQERSSPVKDYVNDVFTVPFNLAGLPAISVPLAPPSSIAGKGARGLVGLQIAGQFGQDYQVLDFAQQLVRDII